MEDYLQRSSNLIRSKVSIEYKIYPIKVHFVIYYGLILQMMVRQDLGHHLEVLVFVGVRILVINLTIEII
jgi:hypothetical protein